MTCNRKYSLLCAFLAIALASGQVFAAGIDAETKGNPYAGNGMNVSVSEPASSAPVRQAQQKAPLSNTRYWDYCPDKKSYYPYVSDCPTRWQRVSAQPLGQDSGYWYYCKYPAGYYPYVSLCNGQWQKINPY